MKKALCAIVACLLVTGYAAAAEGWLTDFEAAKAKAKETGKPILVDFSGSDWCGWCIKLDKEVFSKTIFKQYANDAFVLFLADFPRNTPQDEATRAQNAALLETYGVSGFPSVLLLDSEGKKLAQTGYRKGGATKYVQHLKGLLKESVK